jgi:TetR/AcrR family transcriptional regulator, repressor for uid operon
MMRANVHSHLLRRTHRLRGGTGMGGFVMRRANAQLQSDRRDEILAAAQRCFVRSGFHGASMQEICAEAAMSPGNLYRYFPSKEALIAGIAERDRAEVAQQFARADLSRGLFAVLEGMAQHYFAEYPRERVLLCTEIMSEARRHPEIARISASFDADVRKWLTDLLHAAAERGDIPGDVDVDGVITMLMVIADGVWWRRVLDPNFDPDAMIAVFMDITRHMLCGRPKNQRPNQSAKNQSANSLTARKSRTAASETSVSVTQESIR